VKLYRNLWVFSPKVHKKMQIGRNLQKVVPTLRKWFQSGTKVVVVDVVSYARKKLCFTRKYILFLRMGKEWGNDTKKRKRT